MEIRVHQTKQNINLWLIYQDKKINEKNQVFQVTTIEQKQSTLLVYFAERKGNCCEKMITLNTVHCRRKKKYFCLHQNLLPKILSPNYKSTRTDLYFALSPLSNLNLGFVMLSVVLTYNITF